MAILRLMAHDTTPLAQRHGWRPPAHCAARVPMPCRLPEASHILMRVYAWGQSVVRGPRTRFVKPRGRRGPAATAARRALALFCLLATLAGTGLGLDRAWAAEITHVHAAPADGGGVAVQAEAHINAPADVIWATLTDYDTLDRFIPGMQKSEVLDRHGSIVTVHQQGVANLLFFSYRIDVVVEASEEPQSRIRVRLLHGNLRRLNGGYDVVKAPQGNENEYILRWSGVIDPDLSLPEFVAVPMIRSNISEQFQGMVDEILRRSARDPGAVK